MRQSFTRKIRNAILFVTLTSMLTSCGKETTAPVVDDLAGAEQTQYPIKTDAKLTYWISNMAPIGEYTDRSQFPWYQKWQEKTGVKIDFKFPALGQDQQQFNILIASGDLPDIMEYQPGWLVGSWDKTIEDGYFANIKDLFDYSPNYKKLLDENPDFAKRIRTNEGNYISYTAFLEPGYLNDMAAVCGPIFREDWLKELNLPVPETIDEYYTTLKAFKNKEGVTAPAIIRSDYLATVVSNACGVGTAFYQENGKVKFGPIEPGYKDIIATVSKWYDEGLLDPNIASLDSKTTDYAMLNGKSGMSFGYIGSSIGAWTNNAKSKNPDFSLVGAPYPVANKGEKPKFTMMQAVQATNASISAKSEYKELAARFLDYGYSKEGHDFFNFGIEGETYTVVDGYPQYTDLILKNPDGLAIAQAMCLHIRGNGPSPSIQDHRYIEQYYQLPAQQSALNTWKNADTLDYQLPPFKLTDEENTEFAKIMADINTYVSESYLKFLLGKQPISEFDNFVAIIKSLNIDRAIEIQQNALDRYNK